MTDKEPSDIAAILERLTRLEKEQAALRGRQTTLESLVRRRVSTSLREALRPQLWNFWQYEPRLFQLPDHYSTIKPPENAPRIAIVTPHFDQLQFLKATIDSVVSQNYPNLSYCVQDGDSGEETRRLLKSYGKKLIWSSEPDSGQAQAINRGFRQVSGDLMAYLNSDDLLLPGTLAYVVKAFQDDPEIDLVYGHTIYIESRGWEIGRAILPPHDSQMLKWMDYIPQETLFWRRRVWDAIGPIDESFRFALDWDFIVRAQTAGFRFKRLPRFLACFRVHESQKSLSMIDIGNQEMHRIRERIHGRGPNRKSWTGRGGPTCGARRCFIASTRSVYSAIDGAWETHASPTAAARNRCHRFARGRICGYVADRHHPKSCKNIQRRTPSSGGIRCGSTRTITSSRRNTTRRWAKWAPA